MSPSGSVTAWIAQLRSGKDAALEQLYTRYWPLLVELARKKLHGTPSRAADEEDVAQEAFWGFYRTLKADRVPWLVRRSDLLAFLTQLVARKALNQIKHEIGVRKRGQGQIVHASALTGPPGEDGSLEWAGDDGPEPPDQALLNDCYEHYVNRLPLHLRDYAELYLAGYSYQEIAARKHCSPPTVGRKIALVLLRWRQMAGPSLERES